MTAPTLPASVLDLRSVVPEVMGLDPWAGHYDPPWWEAWTPPRRVVPLSVPAARLAVLVAVARRLSEPEDDVSLRRTKRWSRVYWVSGNVAFHDLPGNPIWPRHVRPIRVVGVAALPEPEALHAIALAVEARR